MGQSPSSDTYNETGDGLPFFQGKAEFGKLYPTVRKWCSSPVKVAELDDILMSIRAPVGPTNLAPQKVCIGRGLAAIRAYNGVEQRYLLYYFRNILNWLSAQGTGTTFKAISGDFIKKIEIVLAPQNEQKRIANKLDQLLAVVDSCKTHLDSIPGIIKRFRQSVLAAATSGELAAGGNGVPRDCLIQEVFENIADVIDTHPSHRTPAEVEGGVPYIGIGDVDALGQIDFARAKKVDWTVFSEHQQRYKIEEGDFIFGKIGTLGKPTKLPIGIKYTISPNVLLIKPKRKLVNPDFLCIMMGSPVFLDEVANASVATSQAAFGIKKMRKLQVTIPSIEKQLEIVRRVEALFAVADCLEARYQTACTQVDQLTPSLLAKAFRGELVPQEPSDEPASVLLARIKSSQTESKNNRTKTILNSESTPLENKSKHGVIMLNRKDIQPSHLSSILKARGPLTAEKLWSASQLDIDDFYEQLKDEDKLGLLKEKTESASDDSRLLEAS